MGFSDSGFDIWARVVGDFRERGHKNYGEYNEGFCTLAISNLRPRRPGC